MQARQARIHESSYSQDPQFIFPRPSNLRPLPSRDNISLATPFLDNLRSLTQVVNNTIKLVVCSFPYLNTCSQTQPSLIAYSTLLSSPRDNLPEPFQPRPLPASQNMTHV
ncbi:hypothetical protein KFK09_007347 [Dendrobium nobile]|uniref:Uncharacterized protein n=1 Tax=Dendrobium nobile TaxID=94219 RepID=A0A8T3BUX4_DENNO|nr:hypothetical protein KFK09_007347 [Dendrobium nobile]